MPVMDGLEATVAIRAIEKRRGALATHIIAVSANNSDEDRLAAAAAGMDDWGAPPALPPLALPALPFADCSQRRNR